MSASVLIYTLRGCPFCVRAKGLLDSKGRRYREIDVTSDWEERGRISVRSGHRTFPQIFIGDSFIGGCDELYALERAGRLDAMLA
jgi:glutaredoxin 3